MAASGGLRDLTLRNAAYARRRTFPPPDALRVAVLHYGVERRCTNMCTYLERCGFYVTCLATDRRLLDAVASDPHVVVVRVDGRPRGSALRREFQELPALRDEIGNRPIIVFLEHEAASHERRIAEERQAALVLREGPAYASLCTALFGVHMRLTGGREPGSIDEDAAEDLSPRFPFE